MIPDETLEAINSKVDILDVVGRYVQLKVRGHKATGLCPFHGERTPSFSVDGVKGFWHCFGCGEGGSVYNFLMRIEGLTFPQAVKRLADEVGVEIVQEERDDPATLRKNLLRELLERTAQYYTELLHRSPLGGSALQYLEQRGFSLEIATKFRLGWAPKGGEALLQKLRQAGYSTEDGIDAGVLRERNGRVKDLLRNRLIFPITNGQGKVIAFGGRLIESNPESKAPKYLNTPETELYQKREHLYGLSFHRGDISRAKEAMVMEGYLDVISVSQAGFPIAVASLGTALTEQQCKLLSRYTKNVHLFYDADRAGRNATEKAIDLFEKAGLLVHIAQMAQGQDPDSVIKDKGVEAFRKIKESTVEVVDYLIDLKAKENDLTTRAGKAEFADAVLPAVAKIRDDATRSDYILKLATRLRIGETALTGQVEGIRRGRRIKYAERVRADQERSVERPAVAVSRSRSGLHAEERLLTLMLKKTEWMSFVGERLEPSELSREDLRPLLEVLLGFRSIERPLTWNEIVETDPGREATWARLMANEAPESTEEEMERLIQDIKRIGLGPRLEAVRRQVVEGFNTGMVGSDSSLYKEYLDLQRRFKGTSKE